MSFRGGGGRGGRGGGGGFRGRGGGGGGGFRGGGRGKTCSFSSILKRARISVPRARWLPFLEIIQMSTHTCSNVVDQLSHHWPVYVKSVFLSVLPVKYEIRQSNWE